MTPQSLIEECRKSGVTIRLDGGLLKLKGAPDAVRIAAERLKPHKPAIVTHITETLAQFRFDLVGQEIEAGYPVEELRRVNNIAWRLITARGFQFQEAITTAAQWVVDHPPHADEAAFIDVMELFKRNHH